MNLGQTIITLGAFILMSTVLLGMHTSFIENGKSVDEAKASITSLSLATSFIELAQGLAFDNQTVSQFIYVTSGLTSAGLLGPGAGENSIADFDDFDDFNGWEELVIIGGEEGVPDSLQGGTHFKLKFDVYYVKIDYLNTKLTAEKTFLKRMDVKVWRAFPEGKDTLTVSHILGYWNFI